MDNNAHLLTQKSTHCNPRANVHQTQKVDQACQSIWPEIDKREKQSQIRECIDWDSEYLSDRRIGKLCRYYRRQKDIEYECVINECIGRISWYTKRQNRLRIAYYTCITRPKLRMYSLDLVIHVQSATLSRFCRLVHRLILLMHSFITCSHSISFCRL